MNRQIVDKYISNVVHKNKSCCGVQSPGLPENKSDSAVMNRSPPKRLPGGARISPYRRRGFLGMPKEAEKLQLNMLYAESNKNSQELEPYPSTRQGSGSLSPAV
ncbi:hypothetical protein V6N13_092824 [Hibiscus sabdariffa]|uniref:Uncharacterized protein n=1 Tax=Hibiscus sabdariffa TaxID=183260 RepID=A0ABR2P8T3_9ROSI